MIHHELQSVLPLSERSNRTSTDACSRAHAIPQENPTPNESDTSAQHTPPILSLTNLHHDLTARAADKFTLRIDELHISRGTFVAIQGPSGCGKTTLMTLLGLARRPARQETDAPAVEQLLLTESAGDTTTARAARVPLAARPPVSSASINDNAPTTHNIAALWQTRPGRRTVEKLRRRLFGFCLQRGELLENLTVHENVELPLRLNGASDVTNRVRDTLTALSADGESLWARRRLLPHRLSGGEYQRVALARAIVHRPQLLLIDEPTANLDPQTARDSLAAVADLQARFGLTVVMITHDAALARDFADVLVTMHAPAKGCGAIRSIERREASSWVPSVSESSSLPVPGSCPSSHSHG